MRGETQKRESKAVSAVVALLDVNGVTISYLMWRWLTLVADWSGAASAVRAHGHETCSCFHPCVIVCYLLGT